MPTNYVNRITSLLITIVAVTIIDIDEKNIIDSPDLFFIGDIDILLLPSDI